MVDATLKLPMHGVNKIRITPFQLVAELGFSLGGAKLKDKIESKINLNIINRS